MYRFTISCFQVYVKFSLNSSNKFDSRLEDSTKWYRIGLSSFTVPFLVSLICWSWLLEFSSIKKHQPQPQPSTAYGQRLWVSKDSRCVVLAGADMTFPLKILLLLVWTCLCTHAQLSPIAALLRFYKQQGLRFREDPFANNGPILEEYDFVVVGSGPAGCALTNRLTENPRWKVSLIWR